MSTGSRPDFRDNDPAGPVSDADPCFELQILGRVIHRIDLKLLYPKTIQVIKNEVVISLQSQVLWITLKIIIR